MNINLKKLKKGDPVYIKPTKTIADLCIHVDDGFKDKKTGVYFHFGKMDLKRKKYFAEYTYTEGKLLGMRLSDNPTSLVGEYNYIFDWLIQPVKEKINKLLKL